MYVLQLHGRGLFTWKEWADVLAAQIATAQVEGDPDDGRTYYRHWLAALEHIDADKGASSLAELACYQGAWERAAVRTPHGDAIELLERDFSRDEP